MWLQFLGAAGTVTGSRVLVEHAGGRLLVDCGMFQGRRELRRRNWQPFAVPPGTVEAVVLTHAHLDHSGWLPRLVREGFSGPVLCTPQTAQLAAIVLRDAAHLQEEDAEHANWIGSSRHRPARPLFDTADAEKAIALLSPIEVGDAAEAGGATVRLTHAGHILGAASAVVTAGGSTVTVSGDLGRDGHPLLLPPEPPPASDALVVESTYGDRRHGELDLDALGTAIGTTLAAGGSVLIPAFAVDRTPVLLTVIRTLMHTGRVPAVPVYVDSPMAQAALAVYERAVLGGVGVRPGLDADVLDPGRRRLVSSVEESRRLNSPGEPCIIVSASGMATGGRVVHHLAGLAPDPRNLILIAGFQVPGTRGRALADGATAVKIFGQYVPVRARVVVMDEFSAHADADQLLGWLASTPSPPRACYVVHGEPEAAAALAGRIGKELGWCAVVPREGERVRP
jgi:metallo-beta-lactamase family protein